MRSTSQTARTQQNVRVSCAVQRARATSPASSGLSGGQRILVALVFMLAIFVGRYNSPNVANVIAKHLHTQTSENAAKRATKSQASVKPQAKRHALSRTVAEVTTKKSGR